MRTELYATRMQLAAKSVLFSYPCYILSSHFLADFLSFIAGAALFYRRGRQAEANFAELRRDIHRIEKGLCFPERRSSFALRFIRNVVDQFCVISTNDSHRARSEFTWARDVLIEYFNVTNSRDPQYSAAKERFTAVIQEIHGTMQSNFGSDDTQNYEVEIPGIYNNFASPATLEALQGLLVQRKSVRRYRPEPVDPQIMNTALAAASAAPSSCNRQPFTYHVVTDPEKARAVAAVSAGTSGWLHEIRNIAVLVGDRSYFPYPVNRHSIYVDSSLSIMPFVLSLEAQGISTCLINWADDRVRHNRMARLLGLEAHERVIISIAFGHAYPSCVTPYSKRKFRNEISRHVE